MTKPIRLFIKKDLCLGDYVYVSKWHCPPKAKFWLADYSDNFFYNDPWAIGYLEAVTIRSSGSVLYYVSENNYSGYRYCRKITVIEAKEIMEMATLAEKSLQHCSGSLSEIIKKRYTRDEIQN